MPSSNVDIKAIFKLENKDLEKDEKDDSEVSGTDHHFVDVDKDAWYTDAVDYVYEKGLMSGISDSEFVPDMKTNRAMIVTILYRLENEPAVTVANSFDDVEKDQWYTDAISWAVANGIVNGYDDMNFGPNDSITREQMAVILYNYVCYKGYDKTAYTGLDKFSDASKTSDWAMGAMQWANAMELITGTSDTTIDPQGDATRAQVAAILMRFCENVVK